MNRYYKRANREGDNSFVVPFTPEPVMMLRKLRHYEQAKVMADEWAQSLKVFWDAVEMVSPLVVRELLPDGCTPQTQIDESEYGEDFRERIMQAAVNLWKKQRIETIKMEALKAAAEYMQEAIDSEGLPYTKDLSELQRFVGQTLAMRWLSEGDNWRADNRQLQHSIMEA